jgi:cellulose synthase/poly-beta-1,6-N-acetylglucosamine synthase-like glycosyltransferase
MRGARLLFWACVGSIAYTYFGYPLILAALARLRGRPPTVVADHLPAVTLLIAAYNERDVIGRKLENSLSLDYPRGKLQILVAADGSTDDTPSVAQRYANRGVEVSFTPERRGKVAAINHAMESARGGIVVFSDANNDYDRGALRELVRPFADATVGGVVGAKRVAAGDGSLSEAEGLYWRYESFIRSRESDLGSCTGAVGEIFAIRRALFEPPPEGIICDDFYIATRLLRRGHRIVYRPEARSTERVSPSADGELKRRANIVAGRYQAMLLAHRLLPFRRPVLVWQIVSHKFMRPLVPLAMVAAAASNVVLAARAGALLYRSLLVGQVAFYGLAELGRRVGHRGGLGRVLYLPTYLVYSNLAALAGLIRFLVRRRTMHLWERVPRRVEPDEATT